MVTFINEMLRVILISFFVIAAVCAFLAVIYFGAVISIWNTYAGIFYVYILIILSVTIKRVASANTY
ncbi:MAG: hypothetical protein Unbinned6437contig1000_73 [Prokaryotic dsDNA virus sp.]|nr:MAG: hypothetical protein Unbinned6437contig1000_73 [Prokaryotic dsDNA virus sp.]